MCLDPVTLTALALSAGGQYLQTREANKNQNRITDAKNAAYVENMNQQHRYQDEAGAAFNHSVEKQGRDNFDQQAQTEADRVKQAFADIRTQPDYNTSTAMPGSTPKNVVIAQKAADDKASAQTDRDVNNLAALTGYQGALFNQGLDRSEFARLFGNTQSAAQGKLNLLPIEMSAAANNANKAPSLFPTLLKGAGMALGMYGAANGVTSFGDKVVEGPVAAGAYGPGLPTTSPGLFTRIGTSAKNTFGGLY